MMTSILQLDIRIKRAYEAASASDGARVLIDRLWPRGVKKEKAAIDHWFRDLAPSTELRRWFAHDISRWAEFNRRYDAQLKHQRAELNELLRLSRDGPVTLIFGARYEEHNDAVVLRDFLVEHSKRGVSRD